MESQGEAVRSDGYEINTEVYSGPLDLLLQLIDKAELDITRFALAQVTDQFLEYMHHMETRDAEEVSAFLVVAAKLVLIKSSALLPRVNLPEIPLEEDPGEELARQLMIYKKFKELSRFLEVRETAGLHTYLRLDGNPRVQVPSRLDLSDLTLDNLVSIAREIFGSVHNMPPLSEVLAFPRVTIRQRINSILDTLRKFGLASFRQILTENKNREEIVVTFLALLELIKRHMVEANQRELFGDIELQAEGEITLLDDQELEFVE